MTDQHYPSGTVRRLLTTDLVTPQTRQVLEDRLNQPPLEAPRFFDQHAFKTLRAACNRLIPQPGRAEPIDLAGAIDQRLADGKEYGWRYDSMPPDGEAYRRGLTGLDEAAQIAFGVEFAAINPTQQDQILLAVQRGEAKGQTWQTLSPARFFEQLLVEATESYYSHPLAEEEIGYVGMADAKGWPTIGLNALEPYEPRPLPPEDEHE